MRKRTVVVGMSGGVDSSVTAKLLLEDGFNVIGLFMHNWEDEDESSGSCSSSEDWTFVQETCATFDIPCYSVNFSAQYMKRVFSYFLSEYKKGRTPNPDVLCNREIKFGPFIHYARKLGAEYIATGHYCGITHKEHSSQLLKAADEEKDQSYFLNQVKTEQFEDVLFPLAKLTKQEVRFLADKYKLSNAGRKDSTGICFIGERKFKEFLSSYLPGQKGKMVDVSGKEIGTHDGLMYYTLGQRRGLNIGGVKNAENDRWYVVNKDLDKNQLIVSCGEGEELFSYELKSGVINFIGSNDLGDCFECTARTRYRQKEQHCAVILNDDNTATVEFLEKQRAMTPGQYVVFYKDNRCLGGGVIESVE